MIAATLFSGIGAPEVAMPHWDWRWHAEIEKFPSAVMAARHPQSVNLGDVTAHDFTERAAKIGRPDVLVFGSPCQSFSVAGKRLGLDDPRGNLALVAMGIVDRLKPGWFVFENVPGLFSSFSGSEQAESELRDRTKRGGGQVGESIDAEEDRDLAAFLARVQDIGYSGCWGVLDAQWFGVAQRRERLFFVGNSGDWRHSAAILLEPESLRGDRPPRRETGQRPAPTIASRPTGGGGLGTDFDCDGGLIAFGGNNTDGPIDVATACRAKGGSGHGDFESETFVTHALRADGFDASEDGAGRGTPIIPILEVGKGSTSRGQGPNGCGIGEPGDPMYTLQAGAQHAIAFQTRGSNIDLGQEVTGTIGSNADRASGSAPCIAFDTTQIKSKGNYSVPKAGEPCHPLAASAHVPAIAFSSKDHGADAQDDLSPTLRAGVPPAIAFQTRIARNGRGQPSEIAPSLNGADAGSTSDMRPCIATASAVRRLTPRECERLQSFPDDYTAIPYRGKPAADGPRYKSLGNSMNMKVIRHILTRIEMFERDVRPIIERAA